MFATYQWSVKTLSCHPGVPCVNNPVLRQLLREGLLLSPRKRDLPEKWRPRWPHQPTQVRAASPPGLLQSTRSLQLQPFGHQQLEKMFYIWKAPPLQCSVYEGALVHRIEHKVRGGTKKEWIDSGFSSVCQSREITLNHLIEIFSRSINFLQKPSFTVTWISNILKFVNIFLFLKGQ